MSSALVQRGAQGRDCTLDSVKLDENKLAHDHLSYASTQYTLPELNPRSSSTRMGASGVAAMISQDNMSIEAKIFWQGTSNPSFVQSHTPRQRPGMFTRLERLD